MNRAKGDENKWECATEIYFRNQTKMKSVKSKDVIHIPLDQQWGDMTVFYLIFSVYLSWGREPGEINWFNLVLDLMLRNLHTIFFCRLWASCDISLLCFHVFCCCHAMTFTFHFVLLMGKRQSLCSQLSRLLRGLAVHWTFCVLKIKCRQEANNERFATCVMG